MEVGKKDAKPSEDVEMKSADSPATPATDGAEEKPKAPVDPDVQALQDIKEHCKQIEKFVSSKEPRFMLRVLRALVSTRKKLNFKVLRMAIVEFYANSPAARDAMLKYIDEPMDNSSFVFKIPPNKAATEPPLPEIDAYLHLLVTVHLLDLGQVVQALACLEPLMVKIELKNSRTLDLIAAKSYFYFTGCNELAGTLTNIKGYLEARLEHAKLNNDFEGQAVLINCLLRVYLVLDFKLYDQVPKLVSKFPEVASKKEWLNFHFFLGRIQAFQFKYSESHKNLIQALRKAPVAAASFKEMVQKVLVIVELLLGDIHESSDFREATLRPSLDMYFQLNQAVRTKNLRRFDVIFENFGDQFALDHTYTLIIRLRHNVTKTAIPPMSSSVALESAEERKEREQDLEYAKEMADGDEDESFA